MPALKLRRRESLFCYGIQTGSSQNDKCQSCLRSAIQISDFFRHLAFACRVAIRCGGSFVIPTHDSSSSTNTPGWPAPAEKRPPDKLLKSRNHCSSHTDHAALAQRATHFQTDCNPPHTSRIQYKAVRQSCTRNKDLQRSCA